MAEKKFYVGIKAVICDEEKGVLLLKSRKGFWDFPGGRVDDDEFFEEALKRELSEEVEGLSDLDIKSLLHADRVFKDIIPDVGLTLLFYVVGAKITENLRCIGEQSSFIWVKEYSDIPKQNIIPSITSALEKALQIRSIDK